jgi:transcriptional regulator with XRE-family HTH domain
MSTILRKGHFLGAKLRALRKRNGLTLEEVSARCIQRDAELAPSVSYLSMIESSKRVPSPELLKLLAAVFQRDASWFLDENADVGADRAEARRGGAERVPLEPAFLFAKDVLQAAIPELLTQTGTTGRQFAHLLIRSHQEMSRNDFPDLERAAESVGERRFPLAADDLLKLCKRHGLTLRWFDRKPLLARDNDREVRSVLRSFFESPRTIYLNRSLQADPARLKFDLASHLAHRVLHGGDGLKSEHATGGEMGGSPESGLGDGGMNAQDVLHAWRDFECSFFAGALLCPRAPFRRFLAREQYRIDAGERLELTPAVVMRRMTKVSPYPHWQVTDPCPHWAVFRMIDDSRVERGSQISVLKDGEKSLIYCCHSLRTKDMAGNLHVLSVGVDLAPALQSNGVDAQDVVHRLAAECLKHRGEARIPKPISASIALVANVLNIVWVKDALEQPARIICPRSNRCPRPERCEGARPSRAREITDVRAEVMATATDES